MDGASLNQIAGHSTMQTVPPIVITVSTNGAAGPVASPAPSATAMPSAIVDLQSGTRRRRHRGRRAAGRRPIGDDRPIENRSGGQRPADRDRARQDRDTCRVLAYRAWLDAADITSGPLLRRVDRHGNVAAERMSPQAIAIVVKRHMGTLGYASTEFAGHSLRRGSRPRFRRGTR